MIKGIVLKRRVWWLLLTIAVAAILGAVAYTSYQQGKIQIKADEYSGYITLQVTTFNVKKGNYILAELESGWDNPEIHGSGRVGGSSIASVGFYSKYRFRVSQNMLPHPDADPEVIGEWCFDWHSAKAIVDLIGKTVPLETHVLDSNRCEAENPSDQDKYSDQDNYNVEVTYKGNPDGLRVNLGGDGPRILRTTTFYQIQSDADKITIDLRLPIKLIPGYIKADAANVSGCKDSKVELTLPELVSDNPKKTVYVICSEEG